MKTPSTAPEPSTESTKRGPHRAYAGLAHPCAQRFGELVLYARKAKCLSQRDVATAVGCTQPHIWHIENGNVDPDLSLVVKLMDVLGIDYRNVFDLAKRRKRAA